MAEGIAKTSGSDVSIVTTGIAGPGGGTVEKPVGLVYIGVYVQGKIEIQRCIFSGSRSKVRQQAALKGIDMLRRILIHN